MDFVRAITFPFDDDEWLKKLGIGVLVGIIPIIGNPIAMQGWTLAIAQRVKANDARPLPDWSNFGELISKGLMVWLASLVYQIPTLIVGCILFFVQFLPLLGAGADSEEAFAALGGAAALIVTCCSCLIVLYAIAAGIVYWGGFVRYMDNEQFSTFMQFGENFAIVRDNLGDFGQALLYFVLAGLAVGAVSSITFGLGSLVATPFFAYFGGHILGQLSAKIGGHAPAV